MKIKWILSLMLVILLILTTNLVDRASIQRISESSEKIYEDRLIAQNLLLKYSEILQKKELALELADSTYYPYEKHQDDSEIDRITESYAETELTTVESQRFQKMYSDLVDLSNLESNYSKNFKSQKLKIKARNKIEGVKNHLHLLSEIQVLEGQKQTKISKKAMTTINLFTKMEIILIGILSIIILLLIFSKSNELKITLPK